MWHWSSRDSNEGMRVVMRTAVRRATGNRQASSGCAAIRSLPSCHTHHDTSIMHRLSMVCALWQTSLQAAPRHIRTSSYLETLTNGLSSLNCQRSACILGTVAPQRTVPLGLVPRVQRMWPPRCAGGPPWWLFWPLLRRISPAAALARIR